MIEIDDYEFVCHDCAIKLGGIWPDNHIATMHMGICDRCGEQEALANVGDYDWPDKKQRGMRD